MFLFTLETFSLHFPEANTYIDIEKHPLGRSPTELLVFYGRSPKTKLFVVFEVKRRLRTDLCLFWSSSNVVTLPPHQIMLLLSSLNDHHHHPS